jgi:hypothetical protein
MSQNNLLNPKLDTSDSTMAKVRTRNRKVAVVKKALGNAQEEFELRKRYKNADFIKMGKAEPGYLWKKEQALKKANKDNPPVDVGQYKNLKKSK